MEELCHSRPSLPRQCISGKHFTLNPCFPRPIANLPLPRKPPRSCEQELNRSGDDEQIHAHRKAVCRASSLHQTIVKADALRKGMPRRGTGMESGPCSKTYRPVHFLNKLAVQPQEVVGPEKIRLLRSQISPFARAFRDSSLKALKGEEGFFIFPMPRAAPDLMTFWEWHCTKQCKRLPIFSCSFLVKLEADFTRPGSLL